MTMARWSPNTPLRGGEGDKAGEAIDVEQAFDFCHADIVTEFRSIAIIIPPGFFQGIFASKGKSYPLKFTKSLILFHHLDEPSRKLPEKYEKHRKTRKTQKN